MTINIIINLPAADDPQDVVDVFTEAGYFCAIPPSGVMPSSAVAGGRKLVHACISGATFQQIEDVTSAQRPVWTIFAAQDAFESPNPLHDPEVPQTIEVDGETVPNPAYEPPMKAVIHHWNPSVWNFLPDQPRFDGDGNKTGTRQQTALHMFQGHAPWPTR